MRSNRCLIDSEYYSNALVLSKEGKPLCTINGKRVRWYLKRNLAVEVDPPETYSRAIKLTFDAKVERDPEAYELAIIENKCVICGAQEKLTLHHVIPHVIRKLFPVSVKSRARQWCVLLCLECHAKVESVTQSLYKIDYPQGVYITEEKASVTLRHLKSINMLDRLPAWKYAMLMAEAGYKSEDQIPPAPTKEDRVELHHLQSVAHQKAISKWGYKFIETHGGIPGTKKYFRELFLACKPTYLPEGYLDL